MGSYIIRNKTIFLFSPEQWGNMKLSKHHYALTLAEMGNRVYFLEPANTHAAKVSTTLINENLVVVNYPLKARGWGKLPGWLYTRLVKREMIFLTNALGIDPDIVWNFDPQKLVHLSSFRNALKIYHPVDQFDSIFMKRYPLRADICFSTIQKEVGILRDAGFPSFFINHGLSDVFVKFTEKRLEELKEGTWTNAIINGQVNVGFAGNLLGEAPDREVMKAIITRFTDCHFHFWGKTSNEGNYLQLGSYHPEFISFLQQQKNVTLYGAVPTKNLAEQMQKMNMFWIYWKDIDSPQWNRFTNPHKIMEYLSTGVPVLSHFIEVYAKTGLLDMVEPGSDGHAFEELFSKAVAEIKNGSGKNLEGYEKRMKFALDQTYRSQISKIEKHLSEQALLKHGA